MNERLSFRRSRGAAADPLLPKNTASRKENAEFLRSLRTKADRAAIGLPTHRRARGLTQAEAAEGINSLTPTGHHIGERRLRSLESLDDPWPQHVADAYATYLRLAEPALSKFYVAIGRVPAPSTITHTGEVTRADRLFLTRTLAGTPAYLSDPLWDMRFVNDGFRRLLPELRVGMNIMEFVLTNPRARQVFPRWESWAVPMLDQLSTALRGADGDLAAGLARVVKSCLAAPDVAELWECQRIDMDPNGDIRYMRPADPAAPDGLGPIIPVQLYVPQPIMRPGWRFMTVTPLLSPEALAEAKGENEEIDVENDPDFWFRHAPQAEERTAGQV